MYRNCALEICVLKENQKLLIVGTLWTPLINMIWFQPLSSGYVHSTLLRVYRLFIHVLYWICREILLLISRGPLVTSLTRETSSNQQNYGFIITLIRSGRNPYHLLENSMLYICKTLSSLHPRTFCPKFAKLKLVQYFWKRRFLNYVHVFSQFRNYLSWEKDVALSMLFRLFSIISPWNLPLNLLHPKMLCAKFD